LFGTTQVPEIDLELAKLTTVALAMVGHTSLSGVQRKVSMGLVGRATLQVAVVGGRYILKPQNPQWPRLPENELLTMRLAERAGIEIPPCGLFPLRDGSLAYVMARFDRPPGAGKLAQEDFCQLAGMSPKEKYDGSAELLVRLVRRYASEPAIDLLRLYRLLVFAWWTGNGDMHLKNCSLLTTADGIRRLSPAYDLLCTRLAIPDDPLALPIGGRRDRLGARDFLELAADAKLPERAAVRALHGIVGTLEEAIAFVERSPLEPEARAAYAALLRERAKVLAGVG
jgi:serine/threonine-protein kinase HipA